MTLSSCLLAGAGGGVASTAEGAKGKLQCHPRADWITVFAFADETETRERDLSGVAAYVFSREGAKSFGRFYREHIHNLIPQNKRGIRLYHTSPCATGHKEYESLKGPDRERITDLMVQCIKQSVILGVVTLMPKSEYEKARIASPPVVEGAGSAYSVCLLRCIDTACKWLDSKGVPGRMQYVFEKGDVHQNEAKEMLRRVSLSSELRKRYRFHGFKFKDKGPDIPQLFAPDLLAWEWQRAHVNAHKPERGEWRKTLKHLFDGTPHIPMYLTATSVGISAIINKFYNLDGSMDGYYDESDEDE